MVSVIHDSFCACDPQSLACGDSGGVRPAEGHGRRREPVVVRGVELEAAVIGFLSTGK